MLIRKWIFQIRKILHLVHLNVTFYNRLLHQLHLHSTHLSGLWSIISYTNQLIHLSKSCRWYITSCLIMPPYVSYLRARIEWWVIHTSSLFCDLLSVISNLSMSPLHRGTATTLYIKSCHWHSTKSFSGCRTSALIHALTFITTASSGKLCIHLVFFAIYCQSPLYLSMSPKHRSTSTLLYIECYH